MIFFAFLTSLFEAMSPRRCSSSLHDWKESLNFKEHAALSKQNRLRTCSQISYFLLLGWHFSPLLRAKVLFMLKNGHPVCGTRSAGGPAAHLSELMTQHSVTSCSQPPRTAHPTSFCHPCTAPCRPAVHSARARRRIMQPQQVGWGPRRSR